MALRKEELIRSLRRVPLFYGLDDANAAALLAACRTRIYKRREVIFREEDPGHTLYIVLSGNVAVTTATPDGLTTHIADRGVGEHVGELSLLDGRRRSATVVAIEDTEMLVLDRDDFFSTLERHPAISKNVLLALTARLREATERTGRERHTDVLGRLCNTLLEVAEPGVDDRSPRVVNLRQHELAERISATRESVNRALAKLADIGGVELRGRRIFLLRENVLRKRAGYDA